MVKHLGVGTRGRRLQERYGDQEISQFRGAQLISENGPEQGGPERSPLESHRRAVRPSTTACSPSRSPDRRLDTDEGADGTLTGEDGFVAALRDGWVITAAVASQISVGAGAC